MFFAAVELRAQPYLQGNPVIVGNKSARQTRRGVVQTCNYEARKYGIHSAMSMHEALQRCPHSVIVSDARKEYSPTSSRIMKIIKSYQIPFRKTSIDEVYIDMTPIVSNFDEGFVLARLIQSQIDYQESLTVSIGMGPSLKVAKMASDYNKPDGITVIKPARLAEFFKTRELTDIPGIGTKSAKRISEKGYAHCKDIVPKSLDELENLFGSTGRFLYRVFHGQTSNTINKQFDRKSISHEKTFHGQPGEQERYQKIIDQLFEKCYQRLYDENWTAKTVTIKIRFSDFTTRTRSSSLQAPTRNKISLQKIINKLLKPYLRTDRGIRLLGVKLSNLVKMQYKQTKLPKFF